MIESAAKKREKLGKELSIRAAGDAVDAKNAQKKVGLSEDSKNRMEIRQTMLEYARDKNASEIRELVERQFGDEKYKKYFVFFDVWIEHAINKAKEARAKKHDDEEERWINKNLLKLKKKH